VTGMQATPIHLGSGKMIGSVGIDPARVQGVGGPVSPQLILPAQFVMQATPKDATLAVTSIGAHIFLGYDATPAGAICRPIYVPSGERFPAYSIPSGSHESQVELRFFLTPAEVERLDRHRHRDGADQLVLFVALQLQIAAIRTYNEYGPSGPSAPQPWDLNFGLFSEVMPFWQSQVSPVRVEIEPSTWVNKVLPGLGTNRSRLVEVSFPPALPDHPAAAVQFEKARRAVDQGRYGDSISDCRGILKMWETHFEATRKKPVAEVLAERRAWATDDVRRRFIDTMWQEIGIVANAPHHPEGRPTVELFTEADARLILLLTATLCEYLAP